MPPQDLPANAQTSTPPQPPILVTENGHPHQIPVEGNLGSLALGYVGLMAWRHAKHTAILQMTGVYSSINKKSTS